MNIVLAVSGSISAYKSYDILRSLVKKGNNVRVVLTRGALQFIKADTFSYLGAKEVYSPEDDFSQFKKIDNILHIDLKNWMDKLVIAPASANTIAKIHAGLADDLLSSIILATNKKDIIIFPAMNTEMWENPITQRNIRKLQDLAHIFIHSPISGLLACGENGIGKLPEVETISEFVETYSSLRVQETRVLITTGATISPLDPVRFLTNPSSGLTGYEFTKTYLKNGHTVTLIFGENSRFPIEALREHPRLKLISTKTTQDMFEAVDKEFSEHDIYISSAAINDIAFEEADQKLKKTDTSDKIDFNWAPDILKSMISKKKDQIIIGFAAESSYSEELFNSKWKRKPVDLLIGNIVSNGSNSEPQGFGLNENKYYFVQEGKVVSTKEMTKHDLSKKVLDFTDSFHA